MENQALFSSKDKSKKLKCRQLQILLGALRVKYCFSFMFFMKEIHTYELRRDKTNTVACAPREDSDQPGTPPNLIRVFAVGLEVV